jgi:hypothetical protein
MMSRLARLYRYAKAGRSESLENFTTEALAAAIEVDPAPLVDALRKRGIADGELRGSVVVHTQVGKRKPEGTTAFIDLEVRFVDGSTTNSVFWVEVKLSAGEHGNQLAVYEEIARAMGPKWPTVITLARFPEINPEFQGITWRDLADGVARLAAPPPYWRDLVGFIEEHRMALDTEDEMTDVEFATVEHTRRLTEKMTDRLLAFSRAAAERKPPIRFPRNRREILRRVGGQFALYGRFCVLSKTKAPRLLVGMRWIAEGDARIPSLIVRVEHSPKKTERREMILATADRGDLSEEWHRGRHDYIALEKRKTLASDDESAKDTVAWWCGAIDELDRAGVLSLLGGAASKDDDEPDDEIDEDDAPGPTS